MNEFFLSIALALEIIFLPWLLIGLVRKTKARLQNRRGAPIYQPFLDFLKLLNKGETISETASWLFASSSAITLSIMLVIACLCPWLAGHPSTIGCDLFLFVYLLCACRFFSVLAALDTGSAFGGFGASREVTLAMMVEPGVVLCLAALASASRNADLSIIFSYSNKALQGEPVIWTLACLSLFLASLVELSRMPVDDPTTHLELTMVHEAMILENSGPNLALVEFCHGLKMVVLLGLASNCLLHAIPAVWTLNPFLQNLAGTSILLLTGIGIAVLESTVVKLRWNRLPDFISYALAMAILVALIVVSRGSAYAS